MPISPYYRPISQIRQEVGNEAANQGYGLGMGGQPPSLPGQDLGLDLDPSLTAPVAPTGVNPTQAPVDPTDTDPSASAPAEPPLDDNAILQKYMRQKFPGQFAQGQAQADANRVTREDLEQSQSNAGLDAITNAFSKAASAAGSVGGAASKSNYADIAKESQLADQNALKDRMKLSSEGEDMQASALKGLANADTQSYQSSLRPLELQAKQQAIDKGDLGLQSAQMDFRSKEALNDPNSPQSQALKSLAKAYKMNVTDDMTGAQLHELIPIAEKAFNANENRATRLELAGIRQENLRDSRADRKQAQTDRVEAKNANELNKGFISAGANIDAMKGRTGGFGKQADRIANANAIDVMIRDTNGTLQNLTQTQIQELAIGINKMLGGSEAHGAIEALVPKNINMSAAGIKDWLTSEPNGTNQQKFVELMSHTLDRERELAKATIKAAQIKKLADYSHLEKEDPERWATLLRRNEITPEQYKNGIADPIEESRRVTNEKSQASGSATSKGRTLYVPGQGGGH